MTATAGNTVDVAPLQFVAFGVPSPQSGMKPGGRNRNGSVRLCIQDNGRGFDSSNESLRVGHGLANMQARAEGLHGAFDIRSLAGQGTAVILELPL